MKVNSLLCLFCFLAGFLPPAAAQSDPTCPPPVLSRLVRHRVTPNETLESIARRYNLLPATLMGLNPSLRSGKVTIGSEILIPPHNGIRVEVRPGQTWRDIAVIYKVRADVLFEANGCRLKPDRVVFVPGVNWSPLNTRNSANPASLAKNLTGYPLPFQATIALGYGWQLTPDTYQVAFHGGLDLQAAIGTPVLAVGDGLVAFAGNQGAYGNLVVINHEAGRQTRYAQLATLQVKTGQSIQVGQQLGTVGSSGTPSSKVPHLHFEVRINSDVGWVAEDPTPYLKIMRITEAQR
ncbi:peptidase [Leptolyngbya sp. 'hensonii']|uniref:M23 family metallopeptidase n=1 Tax=Leptolyngbya sp. 'hensonii' TaxID=1922337 RepID=UPI00094FC9CD|nr:M23 family metallopeptidase [Leptolyngbya sp. 'hensonii']OLP16581.1 peptidase [Leptolyngbya sp. 'hensonii']